MIATKIILTNPTNQFEDLIGAITFFLGYGNPNLLMSHTIEVVTTNSWIENKQNFELVDDHTVSIINYSTNAEKSQLFADSLAWWDNWLPPDTVRTIEQYSVEEIPSTANPILVDEFFYLDNNTIDLK